nr:transposase family protein [Pseudomonas boanensis]
MISLEPQTERFPICGRCAKPNLLIHEQQHIRQVRDRDLQDQRVLLQLPVRRVDCPPSPESSLQHHLGGLVGRSDTSKARETL